MAKNQSPPPVGGRRKKIVVIVGPTASGKSGLGIFLAKKFGGEIISADSRQVYRGMDIGTGKVPKDIFQHTNDRIYIAKGIRHYLIDVADPKKVFTVSDFKKLGKKALDNIASRSKVPFVVGGTGFYIDALVYNLILPEVPPNKKLRAELAKHSTEQLFKMLKKKDPSRAKNIDKHNKHRIIRALEIILTTGKPVPKLANGYSLMASRYDILWLGLKPKNLEKRIKERLDKRLRQGMIKEVKRVLSRGVSRKRLHNLGLEYRWASQYLNREMGYKEMKEGLLRNIVKYSKRQMTWFKRNKEIHWVSPPAGGRKEAEKLIRKFLASHP